MRGGARRAGRAARLSAVVAVCVASLTAPPASGQAATSLDAYRGLGAWIDVFDEALYADPEGTVAALSSQGVKTLFLQTATYRLRGPLHFPDLAGRYLDAAGAAGMKVVAWYVPDFADLERDLAWSLAAVRFVSPGGRRFDSFALDIEVTAVKDPAERVARLLDLSNAIRQAVGPAYPLGAITPSPLRSPGYWPGFPDAELARIYDVYLPMAYWSFHTSGYAGARDYIARSAQIVRAATGRADLPIHMIGGQADGTEADEMQGFVDAANAASLIGASVYDVGTSGPEEWSALAGLRFAAPAPPPPPPQEEEPVRDEPPGPRLGVDLGVYGRVEGAARGSEESVTFSAPPLRGTWEVDHEAFDAREGEIEVLVNGEPATTLPPTGPAQWGPRATIALADDLLRDDAPNEVTFAGGRGPWGIRDATLVAPPLPLEDRGAHGAIPASDPGRADRVTHRFAAPSGGALALTVSAFDVSPGEVLVVLDGAAVGALPPTQPRAWGEPTTLVVQIPSAVEHDLTFDAIGAPGDPWAVRLERAVEVVRA